MKLKALLSDVCVREVHADPETEIRSVACDSRKVTRGALFVAVEGFSSDGNRFIPMAREKGAAVVVTAKRPEGDIPYVLVESDRMALARLGINWYGHPAESMTMIGNTGTNGKTSSTLLLKQVLEKTRGWKVGLIGTMANMIGGEVIPTDRTTPESLELQGLFARMRDAGCDCCVMEVSSHALALDRVGGVRFDVAAMTNLTEDHLDFHKTMESYCDTKALLFSRCGKAVLNEDDGWYGRIREKATCPVLTVSARQGGDLQAKDVVLRGDGVRFTACCRGEEEKVYLPIPGKFTVYNALTVLGICLSLGISLGESARALGTVSGVRGRVEVVPTPGKPYTVVIDYAHTPDGLENVLSSMKELCRGRLIAVFGCGGDRDPIKRPIMGKIATEIADYCIVTSDNPRTEDPAAILSDIVAGIDGKCNRYEVVENRREDIRRAMEMAGEEDLIVLAGKGHETYQEIHGVKYPLDEREVVADALAAAQQS